MNKLSVVWITAVWIRMEDSLMHYKSYLIWTEYLSLCVFEDSENTFKKNWQLLLSFFFIKDHRVDYQSGAEHKLKHKLGPTLEYDYWEIVEKRSLWGRENNSNLCLCTLKRTAWKTQLEHFETWDVSVLKFKTITNWLQSGLSSDKLIALVVINT